jgi:aminopeptidase N
MKLLSTLLLFALSLSLTAQIIDSPATEGDYLRGSLRPERTCFDVHYYDLNINIDTLNRSISGVSNVYFNVKESTTKIQLDLFADMRITKITRNNELLSYQRSFDAIFIEFVSPLAKGTKDVVTIHYEGIPRVAKYPPWDGGFSWSQDGNGKAWIGVSCQEIGASLWWPTKEDLGDEPDSMRMHFNVPSDLYCVSNGQEENKNVLTNGTTTYNWFVSYPINNYNVTLNIADYIHFSDVYIAHDESKLDLDYYVLRENEDVARKQFEQVKPMLSCYETYLGKYPFWRDGYALVETSYLGMEHQGAIAYGNKYKTGYLGMDRSGLKLDFDYIIIHETGHEWWGNSVSCKDIADMWIHESFCTYSEAIYVECLYGKDAAEVYVNALRNTVSNEEPIAGTYGINRPGHGDMYVKGMLFLNTLRNVVNNDDLWWSMIKNMSDTTFKYTTTDYKSVVAYFNEESGMDLSGMFNQYVKKPGIPCFEYMKKEKRNGFVEIKYRWTTPDNNEKFQMPIEVLFEGKRMRLNGSKKWQKIKLKKEKDGDFLIDKKKFYVRVQVLEG